MNTYITSNVLATARTDFASHYQPNSNCEFSISWPAFVSAVNGIIGQHGVTADNLALRFIHRYDGSAWYVTAKCGILSNPQANSNGTTTWTVTDIAVLFNVKSSGITTGVSDPGDYASDYFNAFSYNGANLATSDPGHTLYIGNVIMPWKKEILELCMDNGGCDANGRENGGCTVLLIFSSCSFNNGAGFMPHCIALYVNINGVSRINNGSTPHSFINNAANYATMCPPNCRVYIQPADL